MRGPRYTCALATRRIAVFYGSYSVADDLAWGAMWLYKATGQQTWLDTVRPALALAGHGARRAAPLAPAADPAAPAALQGPCCAAACGRAALWTRRCVAGVCRPAAASRQGLQRQGARRMARCSVSSAACSAGAVESVLAIRARRPRRRSTRTSTRPTTAPTPGTSPMVRPAPSRRMPPCGPAMNPAAPQLHDTQPKQASLLVYALFP